MVISKLHNSNVFLDTAPLIYFIEGNSEYQGILIDLFRLNDEKYFQFQTSSITLLEVMVKPLREGETEVAREYKEILTNSRGIEIFDITTAIALKAAEIRAKYNVRTPDALQLATAIECKSDFFLTNDLRIKALAEVKIIMISELE